MGISEGRASTTEATILAMSIVQTVTRRGALYTVICERPGRDGLFSREWSNTSGALTHDQGLDMTYWVAGTIMAALIAWDGLQETLPT